jgi:hypothetical protein
MTDLCSVEYDEKVIMNGEWKITCKELVGDYTYNI